MTVTKDGLKVAFVPKNRALTEKKPALNFLRKHVRRGVGFWMLKLLSSSDFGFAIEVRVYRDLL